MWGVVLRKQRNWKAEEAVSLLCAVVPRKARAGKGERVSVPIPPLHLHI